MPPFLSSRYCSRCGCGFLVINSEAVLWRAAYTEEKKVLSDLRQAAPALDVALGTGARAALAGSPFTASVANLWELVVKSRKPGTLVADPLPWWEKFVLRPGIPTLAIRTAHVRALAGLPDLHKDPFDRILVAQALAEHLTLATKDELLARYGIPVVWE